MMDFVAVGRRLVGWAREETLVLCLFGILAGGTWGFVELADEVTEGSTAEMDRALVLWLRNAEDVSDPIGPAWFEEMGRDFTALGSVGVLTLLTTGVAAWFVMRRKPGLALLVVVAVLGGLAISLGLKSFFDRPRPDLVPHGSHVYTQSFPSGHAMMSAATYLVLGVLLASSERSHWLKTFYLFFAVLLMMLVGFSRVYLGVHWPTDVLAGWTAGAVWALGCWMVAQRLRRRHWIEEETDVRSAGDVG